MESFFVNNNNNNNINKVVEWSEQLRSVTSVWLGAAAVGFESDSAPAGGE